MKDNEASTCRTVRILHERQSEFYMKNNPDSTCSNSLYSTLRTFRILHAEQNFAYRKFRVLYTQYSVFCTELESCVWRVVKVKLSLYRPIIRLQTSGTQKCRHQSYTQAALLLDTESTPGPYCFRTN
jgi:hypothetical protein